jgi:hypothetical protein
VDDNGYTLGFFASIAAEAPLWKDFPQVEALRSGDVPDLPREAAVGDDPAKNPTADERNVGHKFRP